MIEWSGDICEIEALTNSKSALRGSPTLDAFAETHCAQLTQDKSVQGFWRSVNHEKQLVFRDAQLRRYEWDGRIVLANSGGSHHFAAARYLAGHLGIRFRVAGSLLDYRIDAVRHAHVVAEWQSFLFVANSAFSEFERALAACGATFWSMPGPQPYASSRLLALRNSCPRSAAAARTLIESGFVDVLRSMTAS